MRMTERPYSSEDELQELLARYPELLRGDEPGGGPMGLMLLSREQGLADEAAGSERWSVDHLFADRDGTPTLIEVKRSSDTRIRREVVEQLLEYAANTRQRPHHAPRRRLRDSVAPAAERRADNARRRSRRLRVLGRLAPAATSARWPSPWPHRPPQRRATRHARRAGRSTTRRARAAHP